MAVKTVARTMPETYYELVKQFPLARIRNTAHLNAALAFIDRLLRRRLDSGEQEYLDVLTDLVEAYEAGHEPMGDASEADVLRLLMESNGLSQNALAKQVGISQSTISAVLTGARSLTKDQVVRFARFFRVSPAVFLPRTGLVSRRGAAFAGPKA